MNRKKGRLLRLVPLLMTMAIAGAVAADGPIVATEASFQCITHMTPVRGFYVSNLLGHLDATLKAARSPDGAVYPPGSIVQLVPTEAMVKLRPGSSPVTRDWEFIELDVNAQGSTIRHRGYADVVNRFGGNCFGCHAAAQPQWDMICETTHGCAPVPLTRAMIEALQRSDPRCKPPNVLRPEDVEALKTLSTQPKS